MNRLNSKQLYAHGFYSLLSTFYHTHTREMALNIWHWGDPKKNFNWEKNWQSIHFAFLRGVDKYIIIHAHGHQPQEEKLAFKKVAGSSAAKWRLVWFGYVSKRKIPLFLRISKFSMIEDFATCRLFILWKYNGGPHEICHFLKEYLPISK